MHVFCGWDGFLDTETFKFLRNFQQAVCALQRCLADVRCFHQEPEFLGVSGRAAAQCTTTVGGGIGRGAMWWVQGIFFLGSAQENTQQNKVVFVHSILTMPKRYDHQIRRGRSHIYRIQIIIQSASKEASLLRIKNSKDIESLGMMLCQFANLEMKTYLVISRESLYP